MNIDMLIDGILDSYDRYGGINRTEAENFPNRQNVVAVLQDLQCLVFPGFRVAEDISPSNIRYITGMRVNNIIAILTKEIQKALVYTVSQQKGSDDNIENSHCFKLAEQACFALIKEIPDIRRKIQLDTQAMLQGDPAARSAEEIILSYPGLEAILVYRLAHFLFKNGVPIIPRIMSEHVHGKTGIDIHPGAEIGQSFFIDHGTGIVIGETTIIGNNVRMYQGVTLGALSLSGGHALKNTRRHPTIGNNVTIYSGASILGSEAVIGDNVVVGSNVFLTYSIPANTKVTIKKPDLVLIDKTKK